MENRGKILIIDDNEDVLFALNLLLEPYVEKVKVTTQPARIEFFMTTFQPDVILLDMNFRRDAISGQEGFDCLEQVGCLFRLVLTGLPKVQNIHW